MPYRVATGGEFVGRLRVAKHDVATIDPQALPYADTVRELRRQLADDAPNVGDDLGNGSRRLEGYPLAFTYHVEPDPTGECDGVAVITDVSSNAIRPINWIGRGGKDLAD